MTCYGENLSFHCETALDVVLQLVVDDGVPNRGHRENIFNPDFRCVGIYSGAHKDFDTMSVLDYAASFVKAKGRDPYAIAYTTSFDRGRWIQKSCVQER